MNLLTSHGDKLNALLSNNKVPLSDRSRIESAIERYRIWIDSLSRAVDEGSTILYFVHLLNEYRMFLDVEIIFDSPNDFLYRQKGQLKIDNSVIEEFLPYLAIQAFPDLIEDFTIGPQSCFASMYFNSALTTGLSSPSIQVRRKDQDFTISKNMYIKASFDPGYSAQINEIEASIGYMCAECKTNLDKTMFQEACATAHDLKIAVPGAKYLLICEWLDMTPISTGGTDIDEVLILRKARRIGAQVRSAFSTYEGRTAKRDNYIGYLEEHPFAPDVFERLVSHIRVLLEDRDPQEGDALINGYF